MIRYYSARTLCSIGEHEEAAITMLFDDDSALDEQNVTQLIDLLDKDADALRYFVDFLRHDDDHYGSIAVAAIQHYGERIKPIVPELVEMVADGNSQVCEILYSYSSENADHVPGIIEILKNGTPEAKIVAVHSLGEFEGLGDQRGKLVHTLTSCLQDEDQDVRFAACVGLGRHAPPEPSCIPQFVKLAGDPVPAVRELAVATLGKFGADDRVIAALEKRLTDRSPLVQLYAAQSLGELGKSEVAVATFRKLASESSWVRGMALQQLAEMGHVDILTDLTSLLGDQFLSDNGISGIRALQGGAKPALPRLLELMFSTNHREARNASSAVAAMGTHAESIVPAMLSHLENKPGVNSSPIINVLRALGNQIPLDKQVLLNLAKSTDIATSRFGCGQIRSLGTQLTSDDLIGLLDGPKHTFAQYFLLPESAEGNLPVSDLARLLSLMKVHPTLEPKLRLTCYFSAPENPDVVRLLQLLPPAESKVAALDEGECTNALALCQQVITIDDTSKRFESFRADLNKASELLRLRIDELKSTPNNRIR